MNGLTKNQAIEALLKITFLTMLCLPSSVLRAQVNVKDGSLTFSDVDIKDNALPFNLSRTYNSRSLHLGMFGLGWCSTLDRDLDVTVSGRIGWLDCDSHRKVWFFLVPGNDSKDFASPLYPQAKITKNQTGYTLENSEDSTQLHFSVRGRLMEIKNNAKTWKVTYYQEKIRSLILDNSKSWTFFYNSQGFVNMITTKSARKISYRYDNLLLTEVMTLDRLENRPTFEYTYDGLKNLVQAFAETRLIWNVRYDATEDRVAQLKNAKGCSQNFSYRIEPGLKSLDAFVDKASSCSPDSTQYAFHYRQNNESEFILKTSRIVNRNSRTRIDFDSATGKILNVERLPSNQDLKNPDLK